jgi:hypothetical protein
MLVFQLSGALLLLLNCIKSGKESVIKNCFPGSNVVERDENNNCKIPREKLQESAQKIYVNVVAFMDLVIGYLLAAFSPTTDVQIGLILVEVIVATTLLLMLEYYSSRFCAKKIYAKDISVSYDELDGVDTFITKQEIDDMFKDI